MRIQFYEDPILLPRVPKEVRFNQIGLFMHEDGGRFVVGFDLTPFEERPSIQVFVTDESGENVTSLTIIESLKTNFHLTMHLPGHESNGLYNVSALLFYQSMDKEKLIVDEISKKLDASKPGEQ